MVHSDIDWNATLWAVTSPVEICCFRVHVDASGQVLTTSVADFNRLTPAPTFETALRQALKRRYGDHTDIYVLPDGGASFAYFHHEVSAGRHPTPPPHPPHGPQKQIGFWQDP